MLCEPNRDEGFNEMLSPNKPIDHVAQASEPKAYSLHHGGARSVLALIMPDSRWPSIWRVEWPDGQISDLANLSRAKDAAELLAERGPPHRNRRDLRWKIHQAGEAIGASLVHWNGIADCNQGGTA
jgi:hypothetical protein